VPSPTPTPSATPCSSASAPSIYVANTPGSITVYAGNVCGTVAEAPFATITDTGTNVLFGIAGIALDAGGTIHVTNESTESVLTFAAHPSGTLNETPLATITGSNTGLEGAGIALDTGGKIYVANPAGGNGLGSITDYAANPSGTLNESPLATITGLNTNLNDPRGVAIDSAGKIYVVGNLQFAFGGIVTVYAANPSGTLDEAPLGTITGPGSPTTPNITGLSGPIGVAVDASGKIYVANEFDSSVTVYAANPSGTLDEAPLATIAGSNTGLDGPTGIALDASGKIYVVNNTSGTITIYPANPSGTLNETPLATITGLTDPGGIAVR
jgi:DNA-binding beta-propeller fold protein YncE